ncbi:MAG: oligopeptide transporter, OPT family [Verrucomicrobia bacterium]|nr:oligopeptide transporter, OPT family [Verrucomicrobiota bacterium]
MPNANTSNGAARGGFQPYIPAHASMREFTLRAVIVGTLLGMVFGASSLYLVLKVGLTVSASIPVAVISLALFRLWSKFGGRDSTLLENNIVQTAGSAGESIAFGVGVTMPAIMILGFDLDVARVTLVGLLGGLLGVLMMIPLRRALIVQQHGTLKYPEGTACAEVLKAGANEESRAVAEHGTPVPREPESLATGSRSVARPAGGVSATTIFTGFAVGLAYKTLMSAFKVWKDVPEKVFGAPLKAGSISAEISPELLGVGYIIGPKISSVMMAGGALSYLLLIPLIKFFGEGMSAAVPPGLVPIKDMDPHAIRGAYVLYIGAGAVAAGGIISLLRSLPIILHGLRSGLSDFKLAAGAPGSVVRTERDLPMTFVAVGCLALVGAILAARTLEMNLLGAVLIVLFGFLFVTVSSRLTGEIGSSSNPISGMTVATLLLTCLLFVIVGKTGGMAYVTALSVGGIVCIAASNGGTTSQDLKTGYLVGATPRLQQISILIGSAASALMLGPILLGLNDAATVYVPAAKVAPGLRAPAEARLGPAETLRGPQAKDDPSSYRVWQKTDGLGGPPGKYLVNGSGAAVWLVDPGINGTEKTRPDGTEVRKFDAPKATLMSYIIKGILDRKLPWALVLFGVMIAVVLELCEVSSLAFAVGVYLPISSSTPIFVGGLVRWLVDRRMRHELREHQLDEAELAAESDKSPGVLLASGYIAGGAIAGIVIAFMAGALSKLDTAITKWAEASNPFFAGPQADWLAMLPFTVLTALLYLTGRGAVMRGQRLPERGNAVVKS